VKKLINKAEDVVKEELAGMQAAHPDLINVDIELQVIVRKDAPIKGKVGVISGGGSGHEPMALACSTLPALEKYLPRQCPTRCLPLHAL